MVKGVILSLLLMAEIINTPLICLKTYHTFMYTCHLHAKTEVISVLVGVVVMDMLGEDTMCTVVSQSVSGTSWNTRPSNRPPPSPHYMYTGDTVDPLGG